MLRRRFKRIKKPSWQPPDWLFGPVWTVLYSMMGYASWLVYQKGGDAVPLTLYGIQLFMNLIWTPLFFKQHNLTYALADITGMQILHSSFALALALDFAAESHQRYAPDHDRRHAL